MRVLVLNAGSSSLKFSLFHDLGTTPTAEGLVDWAGARSRAVLSLEWRDTPRRAEAVVARNHREAAACAVDALGVAASKDLIVGHRVVHGGIGFRNSAIVDTAVRARIAELCSLAPLHNPPALEAIDAAQESLPDATHVAVFDTAFYADMPPAATIYAVPYEWHANWGIRRFGFHGISQAYCTRRAAAMLDRDVGELSLVSCHLGNGASAAAIRGGRAIDTTMGFTPMEGLMMGTRSGDVDPGILIDAMRRRGLSVDELDDALNRRSGLLGVSGVSSDYRKVEEAAVQGNDRARLALDIYAARVRSAIGSLAVSLGGIDALIFTGGIGANAANLRADVCQGIECLGVRLDVEANASCTPDAEISADGSRVRVLTIRSREDLMIATEARRAVEALARQ